jgi:hypothetical protein
MSHPSAIEDAQLLNLKDVPHQRIFLITRRDINEVCVSCSVLPFVVFTVIDKHPGVSYKNR